MWVYCSRTMVSGHSILVRDRKYINHRYVRLAIPGERSLVLLADRSSHTRNLEPSWHTPLKDPLRIIFGRDIPQECDILSTITA